MFMMIFEKIFELQKLGEPVVLCTIVSSQGSTPRNLGSKMLVYQDGGILGSVGGGEMESRVIEEALASLENGKARLVSYALADPARGDPGLCGGTVEVFVEPMMPTPTILVVGGGHVGRAVVWLARFLDFRVVLADDREEFCTEDAVPGADAYLPGGLEDLSKRMTISPYTYAVLTTRNVKVDLAVLPGLLAAEPGFVGVIGSRRRWKITRAGLLESGVPASQVDRVISPVGLELNAETPEEIAVSILSEIIMLRRGGDGRRMGAV
jgi:xanthine dehydrogenase accessory factor